MRAVGVLLCAGAASRMGFDKLLTPLAGRTAIERSMDALVRGGVTELVFAVSETSRAYAQALGCPVTKTVVSGGDTRQDSVRSALRAAAQDGTDGIAVIHDAARCMVSPEVVRACIESAVKTGSGIAAVPVSDTVFRQEGGALTPVPREGLFRMQTPQAFRLSEILDAYERGGGAATDDATLYRRAGHSPTLVAGSADNEKLTTTGDWARAERMLARYGTGFDTHRLVAGRKLILGGVEIPFDRGLLGQAVRAIRGKGMRPLHIDATIIAERPKMAPHIAAMRTNIAAACGVAADAVNVKATTTEGMNDEGRGLCISAQAIASVV